MARRDMFDEKRACCSYFPRRDQVHADYMKANGKGARRYHKIWRITVVFDRRGRNPRINAQAMCGNYFGSVHLVLDPPLEDICVGCVNKEREFGRVKQQ